MQPQASLPDPRRWWVLATTCLGLFMALLDVTIVNVAIPVIGTQHQGSLSQLQWIVDGYTLPLASFIVLGGLLGDAFGKKLWFILGMLLFTAGSLLAAGATWFAPWGLSPLVLLIAFRALQGIGAAFVLPLTLSLIATHFEGRERGVAFGIYGGVSAVGTALGPLLGGLLIEWGGWPWIFMVNGPLGVLAIFLAAFLLREKSQETERARFDIPGILTLCLFLGTSVTFLIEGPNWGWTSWPSGALAMVGVVSSFVFLWRELTVETPFIDLRLFRNPGFSGANIAAFALSATLYALLFPLSTYLQGYLGLSALDTGLRLLAMSVCVVVSAPLAGAAVGKWGAPRVLRAGSALLFASMLSLLLVNNSTEPEAWLGLIPFLVLAGLASGLMNPSLSDVAMGAVPLQKAGTAAGINNAFRQVGTAFGIAVLGALVSHGYQSSLMAGWTQASGGDATVPVAIVQAGAFAGSSGLGNLEVDLASIWLSSRWWSIQELAQASFFHGFHLAMGAAIGVSLGGLVAVLVLVRSRTTKDETVRTEEW